MPSTTQRKQALRATLRRTLADQPASRRDAASETIAATVLATPEVARADAILLCLSFGTEVATWNLADQLHRAGRRVYAPRADRHDRRLHVHRYPCPLETLSFGLRQPPADAPSLARGDIPAEIDLVLVLGLAFDRHGVRLGHGAGYFDRFLAETRLPAIGLAFDLQLVDELPREPHDIPMRAVVTESGVHRVVTTAPSSDDLAPSART